MTTATTALEIRRVGPRIGAEVIGVDLTRPVGEATADRLREAFEEHKVLVFRNQHLTPDQHVEAVRIFAEPFDHPTAVKDVANPLVYPYNVRQTGKASQWHIGGLWRSPVFAIESLTYEEVLELGGHTLWADLQAAYDDLSEPFKVLLASVSAAYDADPQNYAQGKKRTAVGGDRRAPGRPRTPRHRAEGAVHQHLGAPAHRGHSPRRARCSSTTSSGTPRRRTTPSASAGTPATSCSGTTRRPGTTPWTTTATAPACTAR